MKIITSETAKAITNVNLDKFRTSRVMKSVYKAIEKAAKQGSNNCSIDIQRSDIKKVISILSSLGYQIHTYYCSLKIYIEW